MRGTVLVSLDSKLVRQDHPVVYKNRARIHERYRILILKYLNSEQLLGPKLIVYGCQGNGSKHLEAVSHLRLSANIDTKTTTKSITASAPLHCQYAMYIFRCRHLFYKKGQRESPLFTPFIAVVGLDNRQRTVSLNGYVHFTTEIFIFSFPELKKVV